MGHDLLSYRVMAKSWEEEQYMKWCTHNAWFPPVQICQGGIIMSCLVEVQQHYVPPTKQGSWQPELLHFSINRFFFSWWHRHILRWLFQDSLGSNCVHQVWVLIFAHWETCGLAFASIVQDVGKKLTQLWIEIDIVTFHKFIVIILWHMCSVIKAKEIINVLLTRGTKSAV